jgi:predicted AlkP superfamily pyrophosphatase or phosphodiesterase
MINEAPLARFAPLAGGLVKPIYADYSFGNIADTIEFFLTGEAGRGPLLPPDCFGGSYPQPRKVVLVFVDSFGWYFWREHAHRFRATTRVAEHGTLSPISALFPSTTAASVSTLNLGVLPAAHALYEWNIYIPAYGEVIQSLAFTPLGRHPRDACLKKGYDPGALLEVHETLHQRLGRHGVRSVQFSHANYAGSAYNRVASAGAEVVVHGTPAEALVQLREALLQTSGKALLSVYWAAIDTMAHIYGPGTPYHAAEIASYWHTFDAIMRDIDSPDTLYLFIADHGQVQTDARETIYLNERIPELANCLPVSPTGTTIYPNGSPRDVFLHLRPERKAEALELLHRNFEADALIMPIEDALAQGLFGPGPFAPELRRRLGDVLMLPYRNRFIWWREKGLLQNTFHGHHGGLLPEEVITVLGAVDSL